jgi:hypothetical protein
MHSGKDNPNMTRKRVGGNRTLTEYQKDIVKFTHEWSRVDYEENQTDVKQTGRREEYKATRKISVTTKGWAKKRQCPPTRIPMSVKRDLIPLFNMRPKLQPEQARVKIIAMTKYEYNVYIDYFVTAGKIKQYFQTLMNYRKEKKIPEDAPVDENAAGCDAADPLDRYKNLFKIDELQHEIKQRGLPYEAQASKSKLVQTLLDHDEALNKGMTDTNSTNMYQQLDIDELRLHVQKRDMALMNFWNASTADLIQALMDNDKDVNEGRTEEDVDNAYSLHEHAIEETIAGHLDVEIDATSDEEDIANESTREATDMEILDDSEDSEIIMEDVL